MKSRLAHKLEQIKQVFDPQELLSLRLDKNYIQKYYKANKLAYSLFHSYSDQVHMGISRDGVYKEKDLQEAARTIEKYITEPDALKVLELASGRGATSVYLAKKYPHSIFFGIELTLQQLIFAQKKAKNQPNYLPSLGDYHNLSRHPPASLDIVFVIEALCHSEDKTKVFSEVKRVLKKEGIFIIIDGYRQKSTHGVTSDEIRGMRLTEIGMAVTHFEVYPNVITKARKAGFHVLSSENASQFILPTLHRFERLAERFFKYPRLAKIITKILGKKVAYNAVSGLLMPSLIHEEVACYYITVLKKS